ncbi:MAG: TonB family protein [Alphaproteobacteria bacterium]|nr:TonB family protein [Alphaproteobacteria bacterium]
MSRILVLGNATVDVIQRVARLPVAGETLLGEPPLRCAGGKGLNQAIVAARTGAAVDFAAAIGDDAEAALLRAAIAGEGLQRLDWIVVDAPTDLSSIWVDAEGRNMIVSSAACAAAIPVDEEAEPSSRLASGTETWLSFPPAAHVAAALDAAGYAAVDSFAEFADAAAAAGMREAADATQAADAVPASVGTADDDAPAARVASLPPQSHDDQPRAPEAAPAVQRLPAAMSPAARASTPACAPTRGQQARRQGPRAASQAEAPPAREEPARGGDVAPPSPGVARGTDMAARPPAVGRDAPAEPAAGNSAPSYPVSARRTGREGRAVLRVVVTITGEGREVRIAESSGTPSLDEAALAAVRQWRFTPARRGGEAAEDVVLVPVSFTLLQ